MTQAIDRLDFSDVNADEPNAAEEYRALVRALRRKQGFGLFFVQASPAKGQEILTDLRRDLPGKQVAEVTIGRSDDRLFDRLESMWEREPVNIFWIEGLEQSLLGYEDMQRLAGWDEQDLMTYSWKDVPPILSHLNLGRERFEARFDCVLVFVVPLFVVKYLLRRAGDFFDWKSGFFEFPDDQLALAAKVLKKENSNNHLELDAAKRLERILQIKDLLGAPEIKFDLRGKLLGEMGKLFEVGKQYEQAIISHEQAKAIYGEHLKVLSTWYEQFQKGNTLRDLGRYGDAVKAYQQAIKTNPQDANSYFLLGLTFDDLKQYKQSMEAYQQAIELNPQYALAIAYRGKVYLQLNQTEKAIKDFDRALELNPKAKWVDYLRTFAHLKLKLPEATEADFQKAILIAQANEETRINS
jgi:tetratricopeptide (TPR) repeat protein